MTCKVCGNNEVSRIIYAKDLNYGGEEQFTYFQCSKCKCLQLQNVPCDIGKYYGDNYYSINMSKTKKKLTENLISLFIKTRDKRLLLNKNDIVSIICRKLQPRVAYELIPQLCVDRTAAVLDVGCGDGYLLELLSDLGWSNLCGVDIYAREEDRKKNDELGGILKLVQGTIFDIIGKFDLIMFHHSLEHMEQPNEIFAKVNSLLRNENSYCMICIPISTCYAFERYGENWVQLDAPRHFFLHSPESIKLLANQANLVIEKIIYDSNSFQIIGSQMYEQGKLGITRRTLKNTMEYAIKSLTKYAKVAEKLNKEEKGDQAIFLLKKKI